jgi:hypothetical protein
MVTETSIGSGVLDPNKPTYITYSFGSGKVLATMQTVEWGWGNGRKQFLLNEIPYAQVVGKGYVILVSGNCGGSLKYQIDQGTNQIFDDLLSIGYPEGRIEYLNNDPNWRVDAMASSADLQWAITSWAAGLVGPWEPLFLIMFDHGGDDVFCVNNVANPTDTVSASSLNSWLNALQTATGASTYVVYTACESGSFIDDLSKLGRVIITSCRDTESSYLSAPPYYEYFQDVFWPRIKMGLSLLDAFNPASQYVVTAAGYHPLLDDDGDGVGHGVDTPASSGYLPHDGDGYLAANVYLDPSVWVYPQIDSVVAKQFYAWPPPPAVTLWAEVENETPLVSVRAWMLPPDWEPPPPGKVLVQVPLQPFNMTKVEGSGNWTVNIPSSAFMAHATGPSNFRFMITAEEAESSAIPFWTAVEFTSTGLPPPDTTPPQVDILRPIDMQPANGTVVINGTATDDVCLQRLELYVNSSLADVVEVPPESSCFFQFAYNLSGPSPTEFTVKAFDTSGNSGNQTVRVNTIRDVAVTNLTLYKTVIGQNCTLPMNVTVANEGQLTEAFNVIVYANGTLVNATAVTLESGASTTLGFVWNTTGVVTGYYIIKAVANPLPYEINLANNEMDATVRIIPRYYLTVVSPYDTPGGMGWYDNGTNAYATLASGTVVIAPSRVRAVFTGWSGDASGTGLTSNAITMNGPKTATANWQTQYFLTVNSTYDTPTGAGWYDAGSAAGFRVTTPVADGTGFQYVFTGWSSIDPGGYTGTNNPGSVTMNNPITETANWKTQSSGPSSVGGIVIPVDKFGLLAPYITLASTTIIAAVATAVCIKCVKRRKEKQ